jgi:uncharacterized protein (DUF1810 family)
MPDPDHTGLDRFIDAQRPVYARALNEITAGDKVTHWMWFIFPQLQALGYSATAKFYGLVDLAEATAYREHPVLGPRLLECCEAMRAHADVGAEFVLGEVDGRKWRSCLTLFAHTPDAPPLFRELIALFYDGREDPRTVALIGS